MGGVHAQRNGGAICHLSNTQAVVAQSSGEAGLNSAVKGISEGTGVTNAVLELFGDIRKTTLSVGTGACEGMSLRTATGEVNHRSAEQLWAQGVIQSYDMEVRKVPRTEDASYILTHPVGETELKQGFHRMEYYTSNSFSPHP